MQRLRRAPLVVDDLLDDRLEIDVVEWVSEVEGQPRRAHHSDPIRPFDHIDRFEQVAAPDDDVGMRQRVGEVRYPHLDER